MEQRKTILFLATIEQQLFRKKISILLRKKISIFSDATQLQHRGQKYNGGMEQRKTILFLATIEQQLFRKKISILFRKEISIFSDNYILVSLSFPSSVGQAR